MFIFKNLNVFFLKEKINVQNKIKRKNTYYKSECNKNELKNVRELALKTVRFGFNAFHFTSYIRNNKVLEEKK